MKLMYSSFAFLALFISTGFVFSTSSSIEFEKNSPSQTNFVLQDTSKEEDIIVEVPATFNGGMEKFYEYILKNLQYPKEAREERAKGKVMVQFSVDKEGNIVDVKAINSIHPSLDAEAVRVIQESPKWNPAIHKGERVKVRMSVPISFDISVSTIETRKEQKARRKKERQKNKKKN